jgi:hypothetical protein
MLVVIHGFDGLFLEIFDGTRSVMITDIAFLKSFQQLKTTVQREARKAHDQYVDNTIFGDMKNNTKQFWSYLKSKKQDSQGVIPLRKDDGFLYSDTETKAEILNDA